MTVTISRTLGFAGAVSLSASGLVLAGLAGWNESLYGVAHGFEAQWVVECNGQHAGLVPADGLLVQGMVYKGILVP